MTSTPSTAVFGGVSVSPSLARRGGADLLFETLLQAGGTDLDPDSLARSANAVNHVSPEAVRDALASCPGHESVVAHGPADTVGAALDAAGVAWEPLDTHAALRAVLR